MRPSERLSDMPRWISNTELVSEKLASYPFFISSGLVFLLLILLAVPYPAVLAAAGALLFFLPKRTWPKYFCILWLMVITPLFGILPLLIRLAIPTGGLIYLELEFLRAFWEMFRPDPDPGTSDAGPNLTSQQWWAMIYVTFLLATIALSYCILQWRKNRAQS